MKMLKFFVVILAAVALVMVAGTGPVMAKGGDDGEPGEECPEVSEGYQYNTLPYMGNIAAEWTSPGQVLLSGRIDRIGVDQCTIEITSSIVYPISLISREDFLSWKPSDLIGECHRVGSDVFKEEFFDPPSCENGTVAFEIVGVEEMHFVWPTKFTAVVTVMGLGQNSGSTGYTLWEHLRYKHLQMKKYPLIKTKQHPPSRRGIVNQ